MHVFKCHLCIILFTFTRKLVFAVVFCPRSNWTMYITLSVCKILFLRKHLYLYDSLNWQHCVYRSSWSIISHWKEEKYIDNYRCYEEEVISSFVLKINWSTKSKRDTVAAIWSLIFTVYIFGRCCTRWSSSLKFSAKLGYLE